jgi:hypothetical protein
MKDEEEAFRDVCLAQFGFDMRAFEVFLDERAVQLRDDTQPCKNEHHIAGDGDIAASATGRAAPSAREVTK